MLTIILLGEKFNFARENRIWLSQADWPLQHPLAHQGPGSGAGGFGDIGT